jgi:hypothetical protein
MMFVYAISKTCRIASHALNDIDERAELEGSSGEQRESNANAKARANA